MTKIVAIVLKGMGKDTNGFQQYVWATEKQMHQIMQAQSDDEMRDHLFELGGHYFKVRDIERAETKDLEYAKDLPAFRRYVLDAIQQEKHEALDQPIIGRIA